ncbi:Ketoreductase azaE [Vanrija pseudolonga]|uniref:Ketoreductase azaE n=1 Tax=Vanrija pseudolonga TaxID=143232 RepID=A0AAF1BJT3_9TREE|nr:Ketoreductase azaE [Vanrija pseudolonga]
MPAIQKGDLVLVSGASGYIATQTVKDLLDAGYPVRGTVRSADKGEFLKDLFKDSAVPFDYVIVKDIAEPGAFDEAVKGVVGVAHTASPFHLKADDPDELIKPAVNGTVGILDSIKKNNPNVKRVVITSSVAAILDDDIPKPHTYEEDHWNEYSVREVKEKGRNATNGDKYRASKTLAEKAFWKWIEDNKPSWDGAAIHPSLVLGPILQPVKSVAELNTSVAGLVNWFTGNHQEAELKAIKEAPFNWVDVRDVSLGHLRALTTPEASGQRFITSNGAVSPIDFVLSFAKHYPDRKTYPNGDAEASRRKEINAAANFYNGAKATKVLGVQYHDLDGSIKDTIDSVIQRLGV